MLILIDLFLTPNQPMFSSIFTPPNLSLHLCLLFSPRHRTAWSSWRIIMMMDTWKHHLTRPITNLRNHLTRSQSGPPQTSAKGTVHLEKILLHLLILVICPTPTKHEYCIVQNLDLFTPGHFVHYLWSNSYLVCENGYIYIWLQKCIDYMIPIFKPHTICKFN